MHSLTLPADAAGQRFDAALARALPQFSRARLRAWIDAGRVTQDGHEASHDAKGARRRGGGRARDIAAAGNDVLPEAIALPSSPRTMR
jgi:23S rRNA pseudouridine1911/1915/1917 synthase